MARANERDVCDNVAHPAANPAVNGYQIKPRRSQKPIPTLQHFIQQIRLMKHLNITPFMVLPNMSGKSPVVLTHG
ncbi:uncharacterized protein ASCRUDRAFT_73545 [Ascoidea rubescens DSM 1968]|uniref:Uncharacterized protein n=1 Tax=Ascoidea rubescens DSM 1968 TaxID=1344418 RepID=A0A1D2VQ81_9ASCO|nr:hypothetical protein ASCRUDRAFT_73545 [Ascoidea rubescens DSM 1968]ODV63756.1 hypothetical protein ASCRUDRAFT_73545 [Ascoidea rubescens DSM 1968]